jgi:two-component system alkaline phosphatase synthesis response regulator PhoP
MTIPGDVTVLVVDDEADVRTFLATALIDAGFKVVTARDGEEALELVKVSPPNLISLDLVMPRKSGIKFHRELSRHKQWSRIPVLIVTGHARDDLGRSDLKELTMQGPGIYLEKPVKPVSYIAAIKKLLGMETSETEAELAEAVALQSELKNLIDNADPAMLRAIKKSITKAQD